MSQGQLVHVHVSGWPSIPGSEASKNTSIWMNLRTLSIALVEQVLPELYKGKSRQLIYIKVEATSGIFMSLCGKKV